jgi:hypothetical protein
MEAGSFSSVTEEWARADERGRVLARPDGTGAAAAITRSNLGPLPTSTREGIEEEVECVEKAANESCRS